MVVLMLVVSSEDRNVTKTMQFEPSSLVHDASRLIREKLELHDVNPKDYGLMRLDDEPTRCIWMENGRSLEYYLLRNGDRVDYRRRIRQLKVRTLDNSVRTTMVDESLPVDQLMPQICSKLGIHNFDEYSLHRDDSAAARDQRARTAEPADQGSPAPPVDRYRKDGNMPLFGTLNRKKQQKMEQLRAKLHTDEGIRWLDPLQTLRAQGVAENETVVLRRKFFFTDKNVDTRDPVQLNLLYVQCRDYILRGVHRVSRDQAIELGAYQAQIEYGDYAPNNKFSVDARDVLPAEYAKNKENEKRLVQLYSQLIGTNELDAKARYVQNCRELPTYGVTFFVVKEKVRGKNKLAPVLFGINKDSVMRVDESSKKVLKEWPLEQVRRWNASQNVFTLDFGDYQEAYVSVQTPDSERMSQLLAGYIDIIMRKRKTRDHLGIEGDEGSTMLEDVVAPAKATLVAHGELSGLGQVPESGRVAIPGVLRSGAPGYGINGAQFGAVGGEVTLEHMPRAQSARVVDARQRAQRALIGTIEQTLKAVETAKAEIEQVPDIPLPRFAEDPQARRWNDRRMQQVRDNVGERLAAMGAATAQVVQWTAERMVVDEGRVGSAIVTIGDNLPEVGRDVRSIAQHMQSSEQADVRNRGDGLVDAARRLCGAFSDFLGTVHPEHIERRKEVLAAAGRVGDYSQEVKQTMDEQTEQQQQFHYSLSQKARNVATSTAQLVLKAKTISTECQEPQLTDPVVQSATQCAYSTSQLVACARVVAPTIDSDECRAQLERAARQVSEAVQALLVDAEPACRANPQNGARLHTELRHTATQVNGALDDLLGHVNEAAQALRNQTTTKTEEEEWERVVRSSHQLITNQAAAPSDLVRDSRRVVRQSLHLVEGLEEDARNARGQDRDRLLDAARRVANATSHMIDATKDLEGKRGGDVESELALRMAAQTLAVETQDATSDQRARRIAEQLEKAAKATAHNATQTISAANAARQLWATRGDDTERAVMSSCAETANQLQQLIPAVLESHAASDSASRLRSLVRLAGEAQSTLGPATRLVQVVRHGASVLPPDQPAAHHLHQSTQQLETVLGELRLAVNDVYQLNFDPLLSSSEQLIQELNQHLLDVQKALHEGRPLAADAGIRTANDANAALLRATKKVASALAQLGTIASKSERGSSGAAAADSVTALRDFTASVRGVCAQSAPYGDQDSNEEQARIDALDRLVVVGRQVVHDSGRMLARVRDHAPPDSISEAARSLTLSLRHCIAALPDNRHVDAALLQLRRLDNRPRPPPQHPQAVDLSEAVRSLMAATAALQAPSASNQSTVPEFVRSYVLLHETVLGRLPQDASARQETLARLDSAREAALAVLQRLADGVANWGATPNTTEAARQLATRVSDLTDSLAQSGGESVWKRECALADAQLALVRPLVDPARTSSVPLLPDHSYYDTIDAVTAHARQLGEQITGLARAAKAQRVAEFGAAVGGAAAAVGALAEAAAHAAYLVGVAEAGSRPGRAGLLPSAAVARTVATVRERCARLCGRQRAPVELLADATHVARSSNELAVACRAASERTPDVRLKRQFVAVAQDVTNATSELIRLVKEADLSGSGGRTTSPTSVSHAEIAVAASRVNDAVEALERFVEHPDFAAQPATLSPQGAQLQRPLMAAATSMVAGAEQLVQCARALEPPTQPPAAWQALAASSHTLSEAIKTLVAAIRDATPGEQEIQDAIRRYQQLLSIVDQAALETEPLSPSQSDVDRLGNESRNFERLGQTASALDDRVETLREAADGGGTELLSRLIREQMLGTEAVVAAGLDVVQTESTDEERNRVLDELRTLLETQLDVTAACAAARKRREGDQTTDPSESAVAATCAALRRALADLSATSGSAVSRRGKLGAIAASIAHSIALADHSAGGAQTPSVASDAHARLTDALQALRASAADMLSADANQLGHLSLSLSQQYRQLAEDSQQVVAAASEPDPAAGDALKLSVQRLGSSCIELVKKAGAKIAHPGDESSGRRLDSSVRLVDERVVDVLVQLHRAAQGTQACINAAHTVSGLIGDLETSILFATSGTLTTAQTPATAAAAAVTTAAVAAIPAQPTDFATHREAILKTAKALVEDTKALVAGAASNQEQLAVAAQNAVRTIVHLTEAVKGGAAVLPGTALDGSGEAQVLVMQAVRNVAAALSNLIHATKHASGHSLHDPAMGHLKEAAKVMVSRVTELLKTVKTVDDRQNQGVGALEMAIAGIGEELSAFETQLGGGAAGLAAVQSAIELEQVERVERAVHEYTTRATHAAVTLDQRDALAAAQLRQSTAELLRVALQLAAADDSATGELRWRSAEAGRAAATAVQQLLIHLHRILATRSLDADARQLVDDAAHQVNASTAALVGCAHDLLSATASPHQQDLLLLRHHHLDQSASQQSPTIDAAESELVGAAASIEEAALRLAELRPRTNSAVLAAAAAAASPSQASVALVQSAAAGDDGLDVSDSQILDAARLITAAVQTLVKAACAAQRELAAQGRAGGGDRGGPGSGQWSEGLISAARHVVAAVQQLCQGANALVAGHASEDRLISAARQVASSTAHLLVACNVKADVQSQARRRLLTAGQAVRSATERLVDAARRTTDGNYDRELHISDRLVSGIAQVMDAQEAVLRKERELAEARSKFAALQKARYEQEEARDLQQQQQQELEQQQRLQHPLRD